MKQFVFLSAILFLPIFLFGQSNDVIIEGQIIGYKGKGTIGYSMGTFYGNGSNESIKIDSLGRFVIKKSIKNLALFTLGYSEGELFHSCRLIVEPGKRYSFISKGQKEDYRQHLYTPDIYSLSTRNDNSAPFYKLDLGQMYYNLIDDGTMGSLYHDEWDLMNPDSLLITLKQKINSQLTLFDKLLLSGDIDQNFYAIAKLNIEYTNAYRLAVTISDTWLMGKYKISDSIISKKLLQIYPKIFSLYPVNKEVKLEQHYCFGRYVDEYLTYLADSKTGQFIPQKRKGATAVEPYLNSRDHLNDKAYEVYRQSRTMSYMASYGLKSADYGRTLLKEQPNMDDKTAFFIENVLIRNVEEFNKLSEKKIPESIVILDENDSINTFNQLCKIMSGKPFLIDLWGTWCLPCRYQFQFQDTLKLFLKSNGIKMVYIAFEYGNSRETWKNFIKGYNLEGYHFISNDRFKTDIEKCMGKISEFPTYVIVDKDGKVVESKAYFPSQTDQLFNQLKDKLK